MAVFSLLSILVGLGQTAFGVWLIIVSQNVATIIGAVLLDAYSGYVAVTAFATLTGLIGCVGSLLRNLCLLIMYATLLGGSMLFLIAVSVFIYIEQTKVSTDLEMRIAANPESFGAINFRFNCRLEDNDTSGNADNELEICSDFVLRQLWMLVWSKLGLSGVHVCLEFLLFIMTIMLIKLLKGECDGGRVRIEPLHQRPPRRVAPRQMDSAEENTSSTAPFLSIGTPPITPSAPLLPGALATSAPVSPTHYNINAGGSDSQHRHTLHYINRGAHSPLSPGLAMPSIRSTTTNL